MSDKRQALYLMADAEYGVQIDGCDYVHNDYIKLTMRRINMDKGTKRPSPCGLHRLLKNVISNCRIRKILFQISTSTRPDI